MAAATRRTTLILATVGALMLTLVPATQVEAEATCNAPPEECVEQVATDMDQRLRPLAKACDHDAVFALLYLRTTEEVADAVGGALDFDHPAYVAHEDRIFAEYYFRAYDNWHQGDKEKVPRAWRIAFRAAAAQEVTGTGNALLGASAHINHDLPFVLEEMGLVDEDGGSMKPDHDRINTVLRRVAGPVIDEIAARFDPSVDDVTIAGSRLDTDTFVQVLATWREGAWRNAQLLVAASTPAQRQAVVESIKIESATIARTLRAGNAYVEPLSSPDRRNAWCGQHGWPPSGY